ncbi:high-potential iron-sulfur protein [Methylocystis sp.]|uniref:high-potential iron-sulfur protein n=1 Tax=Methylocystis sp. TaxID=1911079 RepID=UPI0025D3BF21|nr:high-potential iron-sulfur protein [Methylocystis sp.]
MVEFCAPTRRSLLLILGAAAGAGACLGAPSSAHAKSSKAAAAYRGAPNGRQSCANCSWFNPPSGCSVVSGPVSARGWCNLWG